MKSVFLSGAVLLLLCGCGGDGFSRVPLSGTVSLDGDTNQSGSIIATAADTSQGATDRPTVRTIVTDGKFAFPADAGPTVGEYVFEFSLALPDKQDANAPEGYEFETGGNVVIYNKTMSVPDGGTDSFVIDLTASDRAAADGSGPMPASGER